MKYHSPSLYVIRAFYRDRQAGGAIITFPRDNANDNDNSRVRCAAFALRATDKFLITRINWPDCNCRCACYRRSRRDAPGPGQPPLSPSSLPERNSLSSTENACSPEGRRRGGGARLNARAFRIRGNSGSVRVHCQLCAEFRKSS